MYENILLPYDGSDGAVATLQHAGKIATWADATVHLLFVADTTRDSVTVVDGEIVDVLEQKGEQLLDEATKTLETVGVSHDTDIVQGDPVPTIVDYAEGYDQDLVVMPTHGREGVLRYLSGSVSEKVIRLSSRPVLTVRMQPDEILEFPYETILIPTDGSDAAVNAAEESLSLAASLDATVHVLSVVDDAGLSVIQSAVTGQNAEDEPADAIETVVTRAETLGITGVVSQVRHGTPSEEILEYVDSHEIHIIGMGTTGKRGTDRILLGSVAEKTVRSAPVPVMTVGDIC